MAQDIISHGLNHMMNSKKAGRKSCEINYSSKVLLQVIEIMKKNGYIASYRIKQGSHDSIYVEFGKLNECRSIKPRFYTPLKNIQKAVVRFLPAKDFGIIIISTNKGLMTHKEAIENNTGGSLIAYCF